MLYFAYGSNLSKAHMRRRAPDAVPLGELYLPNRRLVFRGVADCVEEAGARCPGGVYRITRADEQRLDRFEGVDGGHYSKVILPIDGVPGEDALMYYVMNSTGIMPPTLRYLETIKAGYRDFKLPLKLLRAAVAQAWDRKDKTFAERRRRHRDGHAPLASSKSIVLPTGKTATTGKAATGKRAAASRSKSK